MKAGEQLRLVITYPTPTGARVTAAGEIDFATAPILRDGLLAALRERVPSVLVLDLADVTFLDCAGISALVIARRTATQIGIELRLTRPQPIVRRILDLTGYSTS